MTYCILQRVFVFILKQMVKTHPKSSCIQTLICYSFELAFLTKDQQTNQLWCLEVGDRSGRKQLRMTWFQDDMYRISFPFWMFHGFHGIYKQPSIIEVVWSCTTSNTYTVAIHGIFCTCDDFVAPLLSLAPRSFRSKMLQRCVTAWMCLGENSFAIFVPQMWHLSLHGATLRKESVNNNIIFSGEVQQVPY